MSSREHSDLGPLSPDAPALEAARALVRRGTDALCHGKPARKYLEDVEALHQLRVAGRRLSALLELLEDCFPPEVFRDLFAKVRGVTKAPGKSRDADVAVSYFVAKLKDASGKREKAALKHLLARLKKRRKRRRAELASRDLHLDRLLETVDAALEGLGEKCREHCLCRGTAKEMANHLITARAAEVIKAAAAVKSAGDEEKLHSLRIAAKKLRYTLEFMEFAAGASVKSKLRTAKRLQKVLGEFHDRCVFDALVRKRMTRLAGKEGADKLVEGYEAVLCRIDREKKSLYRRYAKLRDGRSFASLKAAA